MYASQADMVQRFGEQELLELTDRDGSQHAIVAAVLEGALSDASALIDGYLAGRYPLPLSSVPRVLVALCCDLARYALYDERASEQIEKRKTDALRFLEQLAKGAITLGLDKDGETVASSDLTEFQSAGSVFGRQQAKGFL
ncbi:gp436 family protein [Ferrimonas balearica]|uniref:gp436 family protein n=1 Tax=Ferrimonas balearica TaxID=44012 RepID=UPI0031BA5E65